MKKKYVIPKCVVYTLAVRPMCASQTMSVGGTFDSKDDGFFSKSYSGGLEDDSPMNLWEEEEK